MTMIRGETPLPVRTPSLPGDPRCISARGEIEAMLHERRTLGEATVLRGHLRSCEDCNALYRSSLVAEARLRRTMLDADASEASDAPSAPRPVLSPIAIARAGFVSTSRGKATWVIALAVLFYAAVRLTPQPAGAARARLESLAGAVMSAGTPLHAGAPARELQRGDWVHTPKNSRARLSFGKTQVVLDSLTQVQIEEPSQQRLRFESGRLDVKGPLFVTSQFGIVEVEGGHATLRIDGGGLRIESAQGNVRTIDSAGEHELVAGESALIAFAR